MLALSNQAYSSQSWPPSPNPYNLEAVFNEGDIATITPGVDLQLQGGNLMFNAGSKLIFQANGTNFGTIDATTPPAMVTLSDGAEVIFDVIGTLPANGEYTLVRGYFGSESTPQVILRNGTGLSISTLSSLSETGFLKIIITGGKSIPLPDILLSNANGISSTVFTTTIQNNIVQSSCESGRSGANFNSSTPQEFLKDMQRFIAHTKRFQSKFMPFKSMPGAKSYSIDMMRVLGEGQLPQSQFELKDIGTRIWMTGLYNYASNNLDNRKFTTDSRGFQFGIDSINTSIPIGVSFAYLATKPRLNRMRAGLSRSTQFGLYGGNLFKNIMLFGSVSYERSHNKLQHLTNKQHYSTNSFGLYGMASYLYYVAKRNLLETLVNFNFGHTWTPRINTFTNDVQVNTIKARETNNFITQLGWRFSHFLLSKDPNVNPVKLFAQILWSHNYKNKLKQSRVQLSQGQIVSAGQGQRQPKNTADIGAGIIVRKCDLDFSFTIGSSFARKARNHSGIIGIRMPL